MKNLITALLLIVVSSPLFAQFEGEIKYDIKLVGEGVQQMAAFLPTNYVYKVKGEDLLFQMKGGLASAMLGEILITGADGKAYMLKHQERSAYVFEDEADSDSDVKPVITKEDEVIDIQGYQCQKYKVEMTNDKGTTTQYMWATNEIKPKVPKTQAKGIKTARLFLAGLDGFPLKIMTNTMGYTMVLTASKILKQKMEKSQFKVPSDYTLKKGSEAAFGGLGF